MTLRTLFERLLDERPATQQADTWRGVQARIERPRARRWVLLVVAASITIGVVWLRTPAKEQEQEQEMYLYIARTDRPSSEALEFTLKESP